MLQLFRTKRVLKSPLFPVALRALALAVLGVGLYSLLSGSQEPAENPSHILMWLFWWPLFVVQFLLLGRFWCAVCPFGWLGDLMRRTCGLHLPVPPWVKKYGPLIISGTLLLIIWAEEAFAIPGSPRATAILLLVVIACAVLASAVFERRAWCRYMCPLGGMGVAYARLSMLQIRGNQDKCRTCSAASCYYGNGQVRGCPMDEFPRIKETNAYCIFCGNCVKSCPKDSAKVELRLPSRELWLLRKPDLYEAVLCVVLGGVISSVLFEQAFPEIHGLFQRQFGFKTGYTLFFLAWQMAFLLGAAAASQIATIVNGVSVRMNFSIFSYSLVPLVLFAHLAQGLYLFHQGGLALLHPSQSPPPPGAPPLLAFFQYALLAGGLLMSLAASRYAAGTFFGRQRRIWASIAPFWAGFILLAALLAWILSRTPQVLAVSAAGPQPVQNLEPLWVFLALCLGAGLLALSLRPLLASGRIRHPGRGEPVRQMRLAVKNEGTEIVTAERALTRLAQAAGVGVKPIFDACTALEELMTYALLRYQDREGGEDHNCYGTRGLSRLLDSRRPDLELTFTVLPSAIVIEMAEEGPPDNPLEALGADPDAAPAGTRAERQIQRLRKYMASMSASRRNGRNVLSVTCEFERGSGEGGR